MDCKFNYIWSASIVEYHIYSYVPDMCEVTSHSLFLNEDNDDEIVLAILPIYFQYILLY